MSTDGTGRHHVGIVMLVYNRADVATLCLQSLARAQTAVSWEVFVLDNASRPEESQAVETEFRALQAEGRLPGTFVRSKTNLGFPGGNNLGFRHLLDDNRCSHVCLLNSDVVVTDHWLDRLLAHDCDAIGPVTNACGNEQTIPLDDLPAVGPEAIAFANATAADRQQRFAGYLAETTFLGFFCCILRLELLTDVGFLDERFGRGGYEDDDYCLRVLARGYRMHIARDAFVLHWGTASFRQIPLRQLGRHLRKGRRKLERKHGIRWHDRRLLPVKGALDDLRWLAAARHRPLAASQAASSWQYLTALPTSNVQLAADLLRARWQRLWQRWPLRLLARLWQFAVVLLLRRPIVVLGRRHPPAETPSDGYFQRVQLIDRELADRWRLYVRFDDPEHAGVLLPGIVRSTRNSYEVHCRVRNPLHHAALAVMVLLSGRIYVHSVLRLADGFFALLYRLARRRVFDIHGVVPEEFAYHGDDANARRFGELERLAIAKATMLVVVTRSMQLHLLAKYGDIAASFVRMPMMPRSGAAAAADGAPRRGVIYCGGLHQWQQLDKMLGCVHARNQHTPFTFLVNEPEVVRARYRELFGTEIPVSVEHVAASAVDACERSHAFGLVLRQDHIVNRVACPTKLVEYLHNGLVPILDSADIGDFTSLGLQYVRFDAPLPDEPTRRRLAAANALVLRRLRADFALGAEQLRQHL